ncbi:MAG: Protein-export rane protein SecF [Bacteriovoracaceae bacterium]|nr:Protein-export rane protein SecF [Bacteriovoracaceae bacterium]
MFELIPTGTKIPFMKYKMLMILFSSILTFTSLYFILTRGFNFGVDFAGGIELVVRLPKGTTNGAEKLRKSFARIGIKDASVQEFGSQKDKAQEEYIIHFAADFADENVLRNTIEGALSSYAQPGEKLVTGFRFTGLEKAYLTLSKPIPFEELKKQMKNISFGLLEVTNFETFGREASNEYQFTFQSISGLVQRELVKDFPANDGDQVSIQKVDFVGAKVGKDLKLSALLSLFITAVLIFVYIFIRFDLVYAPGVVLSLIHDVTITAGFFSFFRIDFDLTTVAALLTLAGYSINDTIIVYDRIREVAKHLKGKSFEEIINISANQTLSRTIITSGTVFLTALSLWIWGGPVIHGFAYALLIGVIVGTYSSIFIAAPAILFTNWIREREPRTKKAA